jgi:hypothetical protein
MRFVLLFCCFILLLGDRRESRSVGLGVSYRRVLRGVGILAFFYYVL